MTIPHILDLEQIDKGMTELVGGKAANLGELMRIDGVSVPHGFCITTDAFKKAIGSTPSLGILLDRLERLTLKDRDEIRELACEIRSGIESLPLPQGIAEEASARLAEGCAYAIRSSATAEDLATASFAGQQDSYLNIMGKPAVLQHIVRCWASLFTERAVVYRIQNEIDHRIVHMGVIVQKMVYPQAAGTMFTADPVSGHRNILSIDASFGLGEAVVSGLVNADHYKVLDGRILEKRIPSKKLMIQGRGGGGIAEHLMEPEKQNDQTLNDQQILQLERLGRTIEKHFANPQDVEWCLLDDSFHIVQSRPITTLYPIPEAPDHENRVYVSVGHQQMMTDPFKPLGLSFFLMTTRAPMRKAGGRLFVDVTPQLASPVTRQAVLEGLGKSDPLIQDALLSILERGDFIKLIPLESNSMDLSKAKATLPEAPQVVNDPALVLDLMKNNETSILELKQRLQSLSGLDVFSAIQEDIPILQKTLFDPQSLSLIMAAMAASSWVNEKMKEWLGEKNAADTLSQSVAHNVTSEMGLALLDVADAIRPYPAIIEFLRQVKDNDYLDKLLSFTGGREVHAAILNYLNQYGMRCTGEIDISRPRWIEDPKAIIPAILTNIKIFEPQASRRKFEHGRQEALNKEADLLTRLQSLPDGEQKVKETKRRIDLIRSFSGYREYPKYAMVCRYLLYKQALTQEAERLVQAQLIREKEDIHYLTFEELRETVRTQQLDYGIIRQREVEHDFHKKLSPPRVITSCGEILRGRYQQKNLPATAIQGLPVSAGIIEGRARIILRVEDADLEAGDILVTTFTDPSWTPLFVSIQGLITEVGGLMTHGAVIAREYGLPAVVGVENATRLIQDGQRIRLNGTDGFIELLHESTAEAISSQSPTGN